MLRSFEGRIRVKVDSLSQKGDSEEFLSRVFSIKGINVISVNYYLNTALILYDPTVITEEQLFEEFVEGKSTSLKLMFEGISLAHITERVTFRRIGDLVSAWSIKHSLPGRVRLHNHLFYKRKNLFKKIEDLLLSVPGVDTVKTNPSTTSVLVKYDANKLNDDKIVCVLEEGLATLDKKDFAIDKTRPSELAINSSILIPTSVATLMFPVIAPVSALVVIYTATPIFKKAWQALKKREIKVDILDTVVIGASLISGHVVIAGFMVLILDIAGYLLGKTSEQSANQLKELFGKSPRFAWKVKDGVEIEVSVNNLKKGDIIAVRPGEQIPVDGVVYEGEGLVDQHALTGESAPVEKLEGTEVFASTLLVGGRLFVKVKDVGNNTVEAKIKNIVLKAAEYKPAVMNRGEKIADKMVLPTLAMSGLALLTRSPSAAMAVVNCDFGTGIRVAAPTAILGYLTIAAKKGIIIKRGDVFEKMKDLDVVIFDKTGTLTHDVPAVDSIISYNGIEADQFLKFAASAEQRFTHPIATAIVNHAKNKNLEIYNSENLQLHVGHGVEANFDGTPFKLGSLRYMKKEGFSVSEEILKYVESEQQKSHTVIFGAYGDKLAGLISLKSVIRSEAEDIIKNLKERGIETYLISGDNKDATAMTAKALGIDNFYAEVLPEDKKNYVEKFRRQNKKVCMVGDGVNDSAALAKADVSVSLQGASSIAVDVADVVFMDGNLKKFNELFTLSEEAEKTLNRSFKMIMIPNSICIAGAMVGIFGFGASLIFNNVFNFLSTINAALPMGRVQENTKINLLR